MINLKGELLELVAKRESEHAQDIDHALMILEDLVHGVKSVAKKLGDIWIASNGCLILDSREFSDAISVGVYDPKSPHYAAIYDFEERPVRENHNHGWKYQRRLRMWKAAREWFDEHK